MSDGITDAARIEKDNIEAWQKKCVEEFKREFLPELTKAELVAELARREGVAKYRIDPNIRYVIEDETVEHCVGDCGPATILVVKEG